MDEQNSPGYPGEEHHYSPPPYPQTSKITDSNPRSRDQRHKRILIGIIAGLLVVVIVLGFVVVRQLTPSSPNPSASGVSTAPTATTGAGQTRIMPTTTSIPTPAPCTPPCVAYQESGADGWNGWALTSDWRVVANGQLLSDDGSDTTRHAGPSAIPPYSLPQGTQNFAIEAGITLPQGLNVARVTMTACGSTTSNGWQGYIAGIDSNGSALIYTNQDVLAQTNFNPGSELHTYRLEVRGNVIRFSVDQGLVAQAIDNKYLPCGTQIGIVSFQAIVHVSSFKVTLL